MQPLGNSPLPRFLSAIFGMVVALRNFLYNRIPALSRDAGRPVVSVGGVHAGGTGKTPMALLVAKCFHEKGYQVAFLSRGHGRRGTRIVISNPLTVDSWKNVGDEPALLHASLPESWLGISKKRIKAARLLSAATPENTVFILDDGFQHRRLKRRVDIVCLPQDALASCLIPAGTLREPLKNCRRADIVCVIGGKNQAPELLQTREKIISRFGCANVFIMYQSPIAWCNLKTRESVSILPCKSPALLCGIARPERFARIAQDMGINVAKNYFFNDHHAFTADEIEGIGKGPYDGIITTEKDAVKFNTLKLVNCPEIWYLKIELAFFNAQAKELFLSRLYGSISEIIPTRRCPS
jgi:tetraacyldisaccharide 4'-kinase